MFCVPIHLSYQHRPSKHVRFEFYNTLLCHTIHQAIKTAVYHSEYLHCVYMSLYYTTECCMRLCAFTLQYVCTVCHFYVTQQINCNLPRWFVGPHTTEGPRGGGAGSYHWDPPSRGKWAYSIHKQLEHHLTAWVFCFSSLCWEISGALRCWAVSIGTLERSAVWITAGTSPRSGIHWSSAPTMLCCSTRLAPAV